MAFIRLIKIGHSYLDIDSLSRYSCRDLRVVSLHISALSGYCRVQDVNACTVFYEDRDWYESIMEILGMGDPLALEKKFTKKKTEKALLL